jgi:hypothetical protein
MIADKPEDDGSLKDAFASYWTPMAEATLQTPFAERLLFKLQQGTGKTLTAAAFIEQWLPARRKDEARARFRAAAEQLRTAESATDRRTAAREFLAAMAELIAQLLHFLVRLLLLLLSKLLGLRGGIGDIPVWKPEPIDARPQVTPRGPNTAFPVKTHRGGHRSSALGSVVLAA